MLKKIANTTAAVSTYIFSYKGMLNGPDSSSTHCSSSYEIRVAEIDGEPWFVASDVCEALGLAIRKNGTVNVTDALARLNKDEIISGSTGKKGRPSKMVSESGLYKMVMRSDKPQAKPFQDWVTRDVLPAIRKTGAYVKGEEALKQGKPLPEDTMKAMEDRLNAKFEQLFTMNQQLIQANTGLKEVVTRKEYVIEEMHDKVNTLAEDKAALESVKAEMEPYFGRTTCLMASMSC